ncbi:SRPBCC family protein [Thermoleophilia bacterium SCSIO 60948]|nr:SRPBCC family protein [Thermoleophilia bacterium SCSIO 60948]
MRPVSAQTTIDAPREVVFERLLDLSLRPSFTDHFLSEMRLQRVEPYGVGASARFRIGDSGPWLDTAIAEVEPPYRITEHGHGGRENRIPTFTVWEIVDAPGAGCELTVTFWTEPSYFVDRIHEPWPVRSLRRGWKRAVRRLAEELETGAPEQPIGVGGGPRIPY